MGEEHTTHARVTASGQRVHHRSTEPTAAQVRQLILAGEPTFSRPKRFPKGSVRMAPQPIVSYLELVEKVTFEARRADQTARPPSIAGLVRVFACGSLVAFAIALVVFVAAR